MARKAKIEQEKVELKPVETSTNTVEVAKETPDSVESPKRTSVGVYRSGELVREYSLDVHGEAFEKLAAEFAAKRAGYELR